MTTRPYKINNFIHQPVLVNMANSEKLPVELLGIIISLDMKESRSRIHFHQGDIQEFSFKNIFLLRDEEVLYKYMLSNVRGLSTPEFKLLMQINLLQQNRENIAAIKIVLGNPHLLHHAMLSIDELLLSNILQEGNLLDKSRPSLKFELA